MTTTQPQVGDKMICRAKFDAAPEVGTIVKVTPSGHLRIAHPDGREVTYKPLKYQSHWSQGAATAHPYSEKLLADVQADYEQRQGHERERQKRRDAERLARAERWAAELDAAKQAHHGTLPVVDRKVLPDGTRLVTLHLQIKPTLFERKQGWEVVTARLKDVEEWDRDYENKVPAVELVYTYIHGNSANFSACGLVTYRTEEEALWATVGHCYHNGW